MGKRSERFLNKINEYEKDETRDRISHSTSYHSFFQGYSEWKVPRQKGKGYRIERIYTADYYQYQESDQIWYLKKFFYLLLMAGAVIALIIGGTSLSDLNRVPFIGIAQVLAWIPIAYSVYAAISQIQVSRRMTIGDYRAASSSLKTGTLIAGIYMAVVCIAMFLVKLIMSFQFNRNDLIAIAGELVGTILIFLIYRMEKKREIVVIKNNTPVPYDANEIW